MRKTAARHVVLGIILATLATHWLATALLAVFVIGASLSGLLPPFVLRFVIDNYKRIGQGELGGIWTWGPVYFASFFLSLGTDVGLSVVMTYLAQKAVHIIRREMFFKSTRMSPLFFSLNTPGVITSRIMDDVDALLTVFASGLTSTVVDILQVVGILGSVFLLSWVLGLILLAAVPLVGLMTFAFRRKLRRAQTSNRVQINRESGYLSEAAQNIVTVKNLNKERYIGGKYAAAATGAFKALDGVNVINGFFSAAMQIMQATVIGLIVVFAVNSDSLVGITAGSLAAAIALAANVFRPIATLSDEIQELQAASAGAVRINGFLAFAEEPAKRPGVTAARIKAKGPGVLIAARKLSFRYPDGADYVVKDLDFTIDPLEKVTFSGRTGVGKSTLFKLMLGLYKPTSGHIYINGYDSYDLPDEMKREVFGYVEQGFRFITGTIAEQITLRDPAITLAQVRQAMDDVGLDAYVMGLPLGYDTKAQAALFSKGQSQLLGVARALAKNPPLMLLDEISANLDSKTELAIVTAIEKGASQRTVVSISHRLMDAKVFERNIVIKSAHGAA